jgi:amino acid adenylation domain-containing protein
MTSVDELTRKAKAGDLQALQQLRDQGFFRTRKAEGHPVSHAQRRLWVVDQIGGEFGAYNISVGLRLTGPLNVAALRRACAHLMRRHESLRTTFDATDGELRQFIHAELPLPWREVDLSADPAGESSSGEIAQTQALQRFDLVRGPLFSATLMRLAPDRHLFFWAIHHIVSDLTSMNILLHELSVCYRAFASGGEPLLAPPQGHYVDFAARQNSMLAGPEAERQRSYWIEKLGGALSPLDLPADRLRPALKTFNGRTCRALLDAALTNGLRQLGLRHGLTLFMTLTAVLKVLLFRYTGHAEIIVGCPVAGRDQPDTAEQVGCFVNMLALRDRLAPEDSFVALLRDVRSTMLEAYEHQDYPFDRLVEDLALPRDMSRSPVFDVSLSLAHAEPGAVDPGGFVVSGWEPGCAASKFDMSFDFFEQPDALELAVTYSTDLFDHDRVGHMADHLVRLAQGAVENPEQAVGRLPLLLAAERRQVLALGMPAAAPPQVDETVVTRFERQARLQPDAVALVLPARGADVSGAHAGLRATMSYGELNARADSLAQRLRARGVGPDTVVGLCVPRSLELVVGLLGILKAGGAYLPLDPAHPPERWAFMLGDAQAGIVVTVQALAAQLAPERDILCIDHTPAQEANAPAQGPDEGPAGDHLAYVIYTSGSTGRPKGVAVTHRNVARLFSATAPLFAFDTHDVWTLFHSSAFDFSVWELWGALVHGGRLVVVPHWVTRAPNAFYEVLAQEGVTVLNQTPSAFRQLMQVEDEAQARRALALRYVIFGGEALEFGALQPWFARHGDARPRLINMYGITETTVHVTFRPVCLADTETAGSRIGRPLPDLGLYLLDANREPVPPGVAGELYVGGAGVARGYLNRAELTAERFVADPFDPAGRARLYRTGDLGRLRQDGDIEYLGRIDQQVQIRGFRVELGEIEAALAGHAQIRAARVLAQGEGAEMRLTGYIVAAGEAPTAAVLRRHLQQILPDYMIPAAFIPLEAFPLTPNGKLDRNALLKLESTEDSHAELIAPRDNLERVVASFFADILRIEGISAESNFFELGGNSLLAIRMISRIRETFRFDINIQGFFHAASVAALAATTRAALPAGQADKIAEAVMRLRTMSAAEKQRLRETASAQGPAS